MEKEESSGQWAYRYEGARLARMAVYSILAWLLPGTKVMDS
jgi:hypothetical protein